VQLRALITSLDIKRALSQVGIVDSIQGLRIAWRLPENHSTLQRSPPAFREHFVDQRAILDYEQVSIEDAASFARSILQCAAASAESACAFE